MQTNQTPLIIASTEILPRKASVSRQSQVIILTIFCRRAEQLEPNAPKIL